MYPCSHNLPDSLDNSLETLCNRISEHTVHQSFAPDLDSSVDDADEKVSKLRTLYLHSFNILVQLLCMGLVTRTDSGSVELNSTAMVMRRTRNQPKSTSAAVRRYGRLKGWSTGVAASSSAGHPEQDNLSTREALIQKLTTLLPANSQGSTSGIGRLIRHTGVAYASTGAGDTRAQNKKTLLQTAAAVSFFYLSSVHY